jgi:hypothetical protein
MQATLKRITYPSILIALHHRRYAHRAFFRLGVLGFLSLGGMIDERETAQCGVWGIESGGSPRACLRG